MDAPTKFDLLRLPQLGIDEILSAMAPVELFHISKVSQQCKMIIKTFAKNRIQKSFKVMLTMDRNPEIRFYQHGASCSFTLTNEIEKDRTRQILTCQCKSQCETMYMYSDAENLMMGCMEVFMEIRQIFNVDICYVVFRMNLFKTLHSTILDWLSANFPTIMTVHVHAPNETVADLEQVLSKLTFTRELHLSGRPSEELPINIPDHFKSVIIDWGRWVRLEHLISFKAPDIKICNSQPTNVELNSFLKSWIKMEHYQNLESLELDSSEPDDMETVLQDIPHTIADPGKAKYKDLLYGVDIERVDGLKASIFVYQFARWLVISITTQLAK